MYTYCGILNNENKIEKWLARYKKLKKKKEKKMGGGGVSETRVATRRQEMEEPERNCESFGTAEKN